MCLKATVAALSHQKASFVVIYSLVIIPFLICSTRFLTRPRRFSNFDVSIDAARRLTDLPGFASGLSIHHDDLPVPSFCTLMKRLCNDKL